MSAHLPAEIRAMHPYAFRSGEWAQVIGTEVVKVKDENRDCYKVQWADGITDEWPVSDDSAKYEFKMASEEDTTNGR